MDRQTESRTRDTDMVTSFQQTPSGCSFGVYFLWGTSPPPPSSSALAGLFRILKPGGFAALSVPCSGTSETNEYYPGLKDWHVIDGVVHWIEELGSEQLDTEPEFHGESGQTLTFRLWSFDDLIRQCQAVGFSDVFPVTNLPPLAGGVASGKFGGLVIARRPLIDA